MVVVVVVVVVVVDVAGGWPKLNVGKFGKLGKLGRLGRLGRFWKFGKNSGFWVACVGGNVGLGVVVVVVVCPN